VGEGWVKKKYSVVVFGGRAPANGWL